MNDFPCANCGNCLHYDQTGCTLFGKEQEPICWCGRYEPTKEFADAHHEDNIHFASVFFLRDPEKYTPSYQIARSLEESAENWLRTRILKPVKKVVAYTQIFLDKTEEEIKEIRLKEARELIAEEERKNNNA